MQRLRNRVFFFLDLFLFPLATYLAYVIRFEGTSWTAAVNDTFIVYVLASIPVKLLVMYSLGMYRRLWRYASVADLELMIKACVVSGLLCGGIGGVIIPALG